MSKLIFIACHQDSFGDTSPNQDFLNPRDIVDYLNDEISGIDIVLHTPVTSCEEIISVCEKASIDTGCIGVITLIHSINPAKMWIKGLQKLHKPLLHLNTQKNQELTHQEVHIEHSNLNMFSYRNREYSIILKRLNIPHHTISNFKRSREIIDEIQRFVRVAQAIDYSKNLKVAVFGNTVRGSSYTYADRVEPQIRFGWEVNYYGIEDLISFMDQLSGKDKYKTLHQFKKDYEFRTQNHESVSEQIVYYVGLKNFLNANKIGAYTDTLENLHGLKQFPGMAVQRLQAEGVGYATDGDYLMSALSAVLMKMGESKYGTTGFIRGDMADLKGKWNFVSNLLEVSTDFASSRPAVEIHPSESPRYGECPRLVFDCVSGKGISVSIVDLGTHFQLVCAEVELINHETMAQKNEYSQVAWRIRAKYSEDLNALLKEKAGSCVVLSTSLSVEEIQMFAQLTNTEIIVIS